MRGYATALLLVAACGTHAPDAHVVAAPPAPPPDPVAFEHGEDELLHDLAALDRRFALRARIEPSEADLRRVTMAALLHEDPSLAVNDGAIDPFSFDARARGLELVKDKLSKLPPAPDAMERELLGRLVDAEVARLDEERALPRSASALVQAIVETWTPPKDEREAADDDRWLARRLAELRASLTANEASLDVVRARDLDDALDKLEHLSTGMVKSTQELVRVRDALEAEASHPAAKAHSEWPLVEKRLRAQVGVTASADELATSLAAAEADLRARAEPALAGLSREALRDGLEKHLFVLGPCVDAIPGSRVRSMAAPPEREPACQLRKFVAKSEAPLALAVLHDHVVVAEWALDVARGAGTIAEAESKHHLLVPALPGLRARLERIALARPASAIAAGATAELLATAPAPRARAWSTLGDVPLDLAATELK